MASRGSDPQQEQRPAAEDDGRTSQDEGYAIGHTEDRGETYGGADVLLDVPKLNVEEVDLEVEDLQVRVSLQAALADLVQINIGLEAELGELKLGVKGVEAQAQLKARLDNVRAIFSEVLASLEHSPRFFRQPSDTGVVEETDDASNSPAQEVGERHGQSEATGAAARRARELGVDLSGLQGTGAGGRIVVRDVTRAAER